MDRKYSNLKEEIMDLFGEISIEEIVTNKPLTRLLGELTTSLGDISIIGNRCIRGEF